MGSQEEVNFELLYKQLQPIRPGLAGREGSDECQSHSISAFLKLSLHLAKLPSLVNHSLHIWTRETRSLDSSNISVFQVRNLLAVHRPSKVYTISYLS